MATRQPSHRYRVLRYPERPDAYAVVRAAEGDERYPIYLRRQLRRNPAAFEGRAPCYQTVTHDVIYWPGPKGAQCACSCLGFHSQATCVHVRCVAEALGYPPPPRASGPPKNAAPECVRPQLR